MSGRPWTKNYTYAKRTFSVPKTQETQVVKPGVRFYGGISNSGPPGPFTVRPSSMGAPISKPINRNLFHELQASKKEVVRDDEILVPSSAPTTVATHRPGESSSVADQDPIESASSDDVHHDDSGIGLSVYDVATDTNVQDRSHHSDDDEFLNQEPEQEREPETVADENHDERDFSCDEYESDMSEERARSPETDRLIVKGAGPAETQNTQVLDEREKQLRQDVMDAVNNFRQVVQFKTEEIVTTMKRMCDFEEQVEDHYGNEVKRLKREYENLDARRREIVRLLTGMRE